MNAQTFVIFHAESATKQLRLFHLKTGSTCKPISHSEKKQRSRDEI